MQGAALPGLMDITHGPDGNIYAASELGHIITTVDPASGEIVARYGEAEGVDAPLAMTVGVVNLLDVVLHLCTSAA